MIRFYIFIIKSSFWTPQTFLSYETSTFHNFKSSNVKNNNTVLSLITYLIKIFERLFLKKVERRGADRPLRTTFENRLTWTCFSYGY